MSVIPFSNEFSDFVGRTLFLSGVPDATRKYDILTPVARTDADKTLGQNVIHSPETLNGVPHNQRWAVVKRLFPDLESIFSVVDIHNLYREDGEENLAAGMMLCELRYVYFRHVVSEAIEFDPVAHTQYIANLIYAKKFMESYRLWMVHPDAQA